MRQGTLRGGKGGWRLVLWLHTLLPLPLPLMRPLLLMLLLLLLLLLLLG